MRLPRLSANPYRRIPPPFPDPELVWRLRQADPAHSAGHRALVGLALVFVRGGAARKRRPARPRRPRLRQRLRRGVARPHGRRRVRWPGADEMPRLRQRLLRDGEGSSRRCRACSAAVRCFARRSARCRASARTCRVCSGDTSSEQTAADRAMEGSWRRSSPTSGSRTTTRPTSTCSRRLPREPFILFVGALREIKGIGVLLAAYERLLAPPSARHPRRTRS